MFAAAVLPAVDLADQDAAAIVKQHMYDWTEEPQVVDFAAVKEAFESAYAGMGIKCADVGALTAAETGGAALVPCVDRSSAAGLSASVLLVAGLIVATVLGQ